MAGEKKCFEYRGVVKYFEDIVNEDWYGATFAVSEKKARANLEYRYKREHGYDASAKIILPGEIEEAT